MKTALTLISLLTLVLVCSCDRNQNAPVISAVSANPDRVQPEESTALNCDATDADGDIMRFYWTCPHGFFPSGSDKQSVIWTAPQETGTYTIELSVGDGGYSVKESIDVIVYEEILAEGSFVYQGREYEFATLGEQTWMLENLAYLPAVNDPMDGADDHAFYYVYNYAGEVVSAAKNLLNYSEYGVLYNWNAAMTACPDGWHLPGDEEWKILERYLGMLSSQVDEVDWRSGGSVGRKMKSQSGWRDGGNGDNSSRFNALPGGLKSYSGLFADLEKYGNFWSSTADQTFDAWYRWLGYEEDGINRNTSSKRRGFSVRCIRD